ncbi:MAG: hypothetical protein ACNS64_06685, partial [Candidatus Halalkalibacterium sp. M3_1C_030]
EMIKDHIAEKARQDISNIPLLPIRAFKDARISCHPDREPDLIFRSSGTSGMKRSIHPVTDADLYRVSLLRGFNNFYDLNQSVILAYTPGYSDNPDSSLVYMINELINQDESGLSRFLPLNEPLNQSEIDDIETSGRRLILFGAAFGLVDLVESSEVTLPNNSIVIETGGMKTHKREMQRTEMHRMLSDGFDIALDRIHSEYGMAELLSQAYALGGKWFRSVPWMQVSIHDPDDPQKTLLPYHEGLIGIIDLANVHSCSFILTGDKGIMDKEGRFQVLGRWNPKDLRGCNFLIGED